MGLRLTASLSQEGSGEPSAKRRRTTDEFLDSLGPVLYQQLRHYLDGVVGSEILRLAGGNLDIRKAYDRARPDVVHHFTTANLAIALHKNGGTLPAPFEAQLSNQAAVLLQQWQSKNCQVQVPSREQPSRPELAKGSPLPPPKVQTPVVPPRPPPTLPHEPPPSFPTLRPPTAPPALRRSYSPVPIPKFGRPADRSQLASANGTAIPQAVSSTPTPAIAALEKHGVRNKQSAPAFGAEQRRTQSSRIPLPPVGTTEERRFSNSPIPLPTYGRSPPLRSSDPDQVSCVDGTAKNGTQTPGASSPVSDERPLGSRNAHQHPRATPLQSNSQLNPTSPQNFRTRARALAWRTHAEDSAPQHRDRPNWTALSSRPYKSGTAREEIVSGTRKLLRLQPEDLKEAQVIHVDFSPKEIQDLCKSIRRTMGLGRVSVVRSPRRDLADLLKDYQGQVFDAVSRLARQLPQGRTLEDVTSFLDDLRRETLVKRKARATKDPVILTLERDDYDRQGAITRSGRVDSLLFAREVTGQRGYGSMRRLENFRNEFRKCREDDLELRAEWVGCAGDITTVTWVSDDAFICGTTEHSDPHNQQYNKPGNLVLGSCSGGTLRAYPDHRIVRPLIEKGENSSEAMRESQSPWLYTSVVSSDFDEQHNRAYTCGFDRTVKIWKVDESGSSMAILGTWQHGGNVNFVAASKHNSSMVATAADVAAEAVRIYHVDDTDMSRSPFRSFSCSRVVDLDGNTVSTEKWAYFPAAMQWGRCKEARHLLAVGYSPRSRTHDDNDIPDDRRNTGELCVWDGLTGERWSIISGSKLNVFEILWHPTQACFIAATSPQGKQGVELDARIRSQIRVYALSSDMDKAFYVHQSLDCHAVDINELTMMPNSIVYCYVTAGCTDGKTYVWDTALGDKPIHVLKHGKPIEEFSGDRESEDTGVKFCAWGTTPDRFYTGSSDGVVKVWNIRTGGKPRPRDLLEVPGPVSFGQFSPDRSKLIIGDATGRVWFLSVDEAEQKSAQILNSVLPPPPGMKTTRRALCLIPHPEPAPPPGYVQEEETGTVRARAYLEKGQIVLRGGPTIGAVQGPNYAETGHFRKELHLDDDPSKPLLAQAPIQQDVRRPRTQFVRRGQELRPIRAVPGLAERHSTNLAKNFDPSQLPEDLKEELRSNNEWVPGAGVDSDCDYDFDYAEDYEDFPEDWTRRKRRNPNTNRRDVRP